jgi:hypothetical protein
MKISIIILSGLLYCSSVYSQFQPRACDILYKKQFIRSINLKNETNQELFGKKREIVKILTEAFLSGKLSGYSTNELNDPLSLEVFNEKISVKEEDGTVDHFLPEQLYILELGENLIFDKHRSDVYFDMEFISILIPDAVSNKGILEHLVSFKFDDCLKIFRKNPEAVSFNALKNGNDVNYAEVLMLRLFTSTIVKIGNYDDLYFDQQYNDQMQTFLARKNKENEVTEYIYKLYHPK